MNELRLPLASPDGSPASVSPTDHPAARRMAIPLLLILVVSLVSATIASIGTVAMVDLTARTTPAATVTSPAASVAAETTRLSDVSSVIEDVAARVSPAVVTITSSSVGRGFDVFSIPSTGVGSGFIYAANGLILTNWHVVESAGQLTVTLHDGRGLAGRVVASDPQTDLAVVAVDASGLPTVEIGTSTGLRVGQLLVAIGSPLGAFTDSVTSGILSATGRSIQVGDPLTRSVQRLSNLLQTDAAINPGNSGGPLLDASGRVVGINTAVATSAEGLGFAIPIDAARSIMAQGTSAIH